MSKKHMHLAICSSILTYFWKASSCPHGNYVVQKAVVSTAIISNWLSRIDVVRNVVSNWLCRIVVVLNSFQYDHGFCYSSRVGLELSLLPGPEHMCVLSLFEKPAACLFEKYEFLPVLKVMSFFKEFFGFCIHWDSRWNWDPFTYCF